MPMTVRPAPSCAPAWAPTARAAALAAMAILIASVAAHAAMAQSPFGVGPATSAPPEAAGGLIGWMLRQQAIFYREFTGLIRAARQSGGIAYGLLGLSFAYGVFHAAGPGHGKAVISSYLVANGESWRRGITLSFASALMQSLVAIAIVGVAAVLLGGTAAMMGAAVRNIEIASYLLVIVVGLRLAWTKGRALAVEWRAARRSVPEPQLVLALAGAPVPARFHAHDCSADHDHTHGMHGSCAHGHHHHDHAHHHDHVHDRNDHHDHDHHDDDHHHGAHGHDAACGHNHGPEPQDLVGPGGWRRGLAAICAAGLRPCSGAIIVLVFALSQGLFWTGVAATFAMGLGTAITVATLATLAVAARSLATRLAGDGGGFGVLALRGLELCAALAIIVVGLLLLTGYMASERMFLV
ncbi:MAG TPA: nickel/cobalt transporter [Xanthobacteraceae bacterium]|nr:nickel/cobalt transporter [Xanthobacteraceae bacterium]